MLKQPLFGQDSSPHRTSMLLSSIITLICWIIFCTMTFLVKFKPKTPQYKEVQIVLSSEKADDEREKSKSESAPAAFEEAAMTEPENAMVEPVETAAPPAPVEPEPASTPAPTPAPAQKTTTAKSAPAPKTAATPKKETTAPKKETPAPKATDPAKKVNFDDYQYANDYSDFDFNNVSANKKKQDFDWSQFDDNSEPEPKVSQKVDKVTSSSSISGSAAAKTTDNNQKQTSQKSTQTQTNQSASKSTSTALSNIAKSTSYSTTSGDSKTITNAKTSKTSDGQISMEMSDGSTRVLINPSTPTIKLSEPAAALIDGTKVVSIKFRVVESGNVPRAEISITPASILPREVRDEIIDQLSRWLFEAASTSATATFEYTIEKR